MDPDPAHPRSRTDDLGLPSLASCSQCHAQIPVPGGKPGQRLRCPTCGGEARVNTSLQDEAAAAIKADRTGPRQPALKLLSLAICSALLATLAVALLWATWPAAEAPPSATHAVSATPSEAAGTSSGDAATSTQEEAMQAIEQLQMAWSLQTEPGLDARAIRESDLNAMATLDQAIAKQRHSAILLAWRAEARRRRLDLPGAEDDLRSALLLRPDLPELSTQLAMTLVDKAAMGLDARLSEVQAGLVPDLAVLEKAADAFVRGRAYDEPASDQVRDRLPLPLEGSEEAAGRIEVAMAIAFARADEIHNTLQQLESQIDAARDGRMWRLVGLARTSLGQRAAAITAYERAADLRPHDPQTVTDRALARHQANEGQGSLDDFDHALTLVPGSATVLILRGLTSMARRSLEGARRDFDLAIEQNPACPAAWASRARLHKLKDEPEEELADLDRLLAFNASSQLGLLRRSELLLNLGQPKRALADARRSADLAPDSAPAYYLQARSHRALKNFDAAAEAFNTAVALASPAASQAGSPALRRAQGRPPSRKVLFLVSLYRERGLFYMERGNPTKADQDLSRALELLPESLLLWSLRANVRLLLNDSEGAYADFNQALRRNPGDVLAREGRARMRLARKELRGALDDINNALSKAPEEPRLYQLRGLIRRNANDLTGAFADHQRAVDLAPDNPRYLFSRGTSRLLLGEFPEATDDLQKALSLTSDGELATQIRSTLTKIEALRQGDR